MDELRAFPFGATVASAVGPIALLIIHHGMRHGLAAARSLVPDDRLVRGLNIASGGAIALFGLYGLLRAL